jgi:hypothetical protein
METFFQPSFDCIVQAVKEQQRTSQNPISVSYEGFKALI